MMTAKAVANRQELIDTIISNMEKNLPPWELGTVRMNHHNPLSGTEYKGINRLYLAYAAQKNGWTDNRWATLRQASKEGHKLKKGSKATYIEFFSQKEVLEKNEKTGEEEKVIKTIVQLYPVFNAEQFESFKEKEKIDPGKQIEELDTIIANSEAPIIYENNEMNAYSPELDTIYITQRESWKSPDYFYSTVLHEIAHSTGHESRLNRPIENEFGSTEYAKEELIAELSSAILYDKYGIENKERQMENTAAYIKSWTKLLKDSPKELWQALQQADKAVTYIKENMLEKFQSLDKEKVEAPYNEKQTQEIREDVANGFTEEKVEISNSKYTSDQMFQIQLAFKEGFTEEQIKLYSDPRFDASQMEQIRWGIKDGLTEEQIKLYSDSRFDASQMEQIRWGIKDGLSIEQVKLYLDSKYNDTQMNEIRLGFMKGLTEEQIKLYTDSKYTSDQMEQIRLGLEEGLTKKQIEMYADSKYKANQMNEIRLGLKQGLTKEQIELYADSKYTSDQMEQIREGFKSGLTKDEVALYANPATSFKEMLKKRISLLVNKEKKTDDKMPEKNSYEKQQSTLDPKLKNFLNTADDPSFRKYIESIMPNRNVSQFYIETKAKGRESVFADELQKQNNRFSENVDLLKAIDKVQKSKGVSYDR